MKSCDFFVLSVSAIMIAVAWMMITYETADCAERPQARHGTIHIEDMDDE